MPKLFLLPLLLVLAACGNNVSVPPDGEKFETKFVKMLPDTTRMMLIQDVVVSYGDLYVEADSALLEKPKQTITVFGAKKITFQRKPIEPGPHNDTMIYNKLQGTLITN